MENPEQQPTSLNDRLRAIQETLRGGEERTKSEQDQKNQEKRERLKGLIESLKSALNLGGVSSEDAKPVLEKLREKRESPENYKDSTKVEFLKAEDKDGNIFRIVLALGEKVGPRGTFRDDPKTGEMVPCVDGHERLGFSEEDSRDLWYKAPSRPVLLKENFVPIERVSEGGKYLYGEFQYDRSMETEGGVWVVDNSNFETPGTDLGRYQLDYIEPKEEQKDKEKFFPGNDLYGSKSSERIKGILNKVRIVEITGEPGPEYLTRVAEELEKHGVSPVDITEAVEKTVGSILEQMAREELNKAGQ